jgi:hypothetical protein
MQKRKLSFKNVDDITAEVNRLRAGCRNKGNWSLAQTCWHLNVTLKYSMRPGPHEAVEVDPKYREIGRRIIAEGEIPGTLQAPERAVPPMNVSDTEIDDFLSSLQALKAFNGPFPPHRLFGTLPEADYMKLHLIHSAHHLDNLIPKKVASG